MYTGRKDNIVSMIDSPFFEYITHDITDKIDIQLDEIYNFACPASPPAYQKSPIFTTKTCVIGALNMLDLAEKNNAKILHASTSEVYGDPLEHPQEESYCGHVNPIGVRSCYDEGKRCAESLCFDHNRQYGTKIKIIRIFNTYGPNMDPNDGRVVSNFINQALSGEDITIYGDGKQTRSFCFVDDLVGGIIRMMESEDEFLGPVNLGNPIEFTVMELANIVIEMTKSKSKIKFCPMPSDDPKQRCPSIELARKKLGWYPTIHLRQGLEATIHHFRLCLHEFCDMSKGIPQ